MQALSQNNCFRTKDSHWVGTSLDHTVPEALAFAENQGNSIKLIVEKVKQNSLYVNST